MQDAFEQSRGEKPSTKETYVFKEAMFDAVKAANHSSYVDKKPKYPKGFWSYLLELDRAMTSSSYLFDAAMIYDYERRFLWD